MADPVIVGSGAKSQPAGAGVLSRLQEFQAGQEEDIAKQRGQVPNVDVRSAFEDVMSSTTNEEIINKGYTTIGTTRITPSTIAAINADEGKRARLFAKFKGEFTVPAQEADRAAVGFSGPAYEETRLPDKFAGDPMIQAYLSRQQNVAKLLEGSNLPVRGQELFIRDYAGQYFGRTGAEVTREIMDIPTMISQDLPTLFSMAISASGAAVSATTDYVFGDYEETLAESFSRRYGDIFQDLYGGRGAGAFNLRDLEQLTEGNEFLGNSRQRLEAWYKRKYIDKYGQDAWIRDHAFPEKMELKINDQGEASLEPQYDDKGNPLYDESLDPNIAAGLVDASFQSLSDPAQAAVFFGGGGPLVIANITRKVYKGTRIMDQVDAARERDPDRYQELTNTQVYEQLVRERRNVAWRTWGRTWNKLTLKAYKGETHMGEVMQMHTRAIDNYDNKINRLESEIDDLKAIPKLNEEEARRLKDLEADLNFNKTSRTKYINRSGRAGVLLNPYVKNSVFDEAFISSAMAFAPSFIPTDTLGMSEGTAEFITALTAPIFAPYAGRKLAKIGAEGRRVPILGTGVLAVEDVASHLQSSEILSRVGVGMIIRGEIDELRAAAEMEGIVLSDDDIAAFRYFNRALLNMGDEAIEVGGKMVTVRDQVYDSLVNYGENMRRMRDRMMTMKDANGELVFSPEEIASNMQSMHLSLAYASGFAPFMQIQKLAAQGKSVTQIFEGGAATELFKSIRTQDQVLRGMTTQLNVFRKSLASKGLNLDSNDPINATILRLERSYEAGMDDLTLRRQQLNQLLDLYMAHPAGVDESTIDEIVDLKLMLMPEDVRRDINRAQVADEVAETLTENFAIRQKELTELAGEMRPDELNTYIQREADSLFDISLGVRRARGSARYEAPNKYAEDNGIVLTLDSMVAKLAEMPDDLKDGGLDFAFRGGREFIRRGGKDLENTFEAMARQGMEAQYGADAERMLEIAVEKGNIENGTYTELALFFGEKDKSGSPLQLFVGTVEQLEDVRRVFAYEAALSAASDKPNYRSAAQYLKEYADATDDVFREADPTGELLRLMETARTGWKTDVGDVTEGGTYAGKVIKSRNRKINNVVDDTGDAGLPENQRRYLYGNRNTPEGAFVEIGGIMADIALETNPARVNDLQARLSGAKQDLMLFYGINYEGNIPTFDMRDPKQRRIANSYSALMQAIINNKVGYALSADLGPLAKEANISKLPKELQPKVRTATQRLAEQQKTLPEFNFERANNLLEAEQMLSINVIEMNGTPGTRTPVSTELRQNLASVDDMLATNQEYKKAFEEMRVDLTSTESRLRAAGNATLEKQAAALAKLERISGSIRNPEQFFDRYLEGLNEEGFEALKQTFRVGGMTDNEITIAIQEMYVRGLLQKSGLTYKRLSGFGGDAVEDITDVEVLVNYVNGPQRATMEVILGKDHAKHLDDIAQWMDNATGNGAGVKAYLDVGEMRMESKIARVFNLARGMVGLDYVSAEVGFRLMMQKRQEMIQFILSNENASRVLSRILNNPKAVTRDDLKILGAEVRSHLMLELLKGEEGVVVPTLDEMLGNELPVGLKAIAEDVKEEEDQEKRDAAGVDVQQQLQEIFGDTDEKNE
jgi:hypothetical protein